MNCQHDIGAESLLGRNVTATCCWSRGGGWREQQMVTTPQGVRANPACRSIWMLGSLGNAHARGQQGLCHLASMWCGIRGLGMCESDGTASRFWLAWVNWACIASIFECGHRIRKYL